MPSKFENLLNELKQRNDIRKMSPLEQKFLNYLNSVGITFYKTEYQVGFYFIDIALPEIKFGIELDGETYHKGREEHDRKKDEYLKKRGWTIRRIPSKSVWRKELVAPILEEIYRFITKNDIRPWAIAELYSPDEPVRAIPKKQKEENLNHYMGYCEKCGSYYWDGKPCKCN